MTVVRSKYPRNVAKSSISKLQLTWTQDIYLLSPNVCCRALLYRKPQSVSKLVVMLQQSRLRPIFKVSKLGKLLLFQQKNVTTASRIQNQVHEGILWFKKKTQNCLKWSHSNVTQRNLQLKHRSFIIQGSEDIYFSHDWQLSNLTVWETAYRLMFRWQWLNSNQCKNSNASWMVEYH